MYFCEQRGSTALVFVFLHAAVLLSLPPVALTFVCAGLRVMASGVFFRDGGFLHGDLWNASALPG